MKKLSFISLLILSITLMSFIGKEKSTIPTGTFSGGSENPVVQLKLNNDNTFSYKDESSVNNTINVKGTWEQKGNSIVLNSTDNNQKFHNTWKVDKNQNCVKSRKGLSFYRLCM